MSWRSLLKRLGVVSTQEWEDLQVAQEVVRRHHLRFTHMGQAGILRYLHRLGDRDPRLARAVQVELEARGLLG